MEVRELVTDRKEGRGNVRDKDEATKILREAFDAVSAAELPKEVQSVALGKAVDLIAGLGSTTAAREVRREVPEVDVSDLLGKIAAKFQVDRELIEDTYEVVDGSVNLAVGRTKLETAKTKGTKQVAHLLAAGRQAAGLEDSTETKVIRAVADDYGKLDSPNFASAVAELDEFFKITGEGAAKRLKARRGAFEEAGKLVTKLLVPPATR